MTNRRVPARFTVAVVGMLAIAGLCGSPLRAQADHQHEAALRNGPTNALVKVVREVTEPFKDVSAALVGDGLIDARQPEIVIYEPAGNNRVRLIGADYLVLADQWDMTHTSAPELMGQKFQQFEAPNRFGLPRFYTLHVWAWKDSPTGTFVNWNTNVSCDGYSGTTR